MGLLIIAAALAPFVGGAAVLDWRNRRRRKTGHRPFNVHTAQQREIALGLDLADLGDD